MTSVSNGGTTTLGLYDTQSQLNQKADITYVDNKVDPLIGGHKGFATLALAQAQADQSGLAANTVVEVLSDTTESNNGYYLWNGTALNKTPFSPLVQANNYTDSKVATAKAEAIAAAASDATSKSNNAVTTANTYTDSVFADVPTTLEPYVTQAEAAATAANIAGKVYATPSEGVTPVTGVPSGQYFNVRSSSNDNYIDEYLNNAGVAQATGKSYPSNNYLNNLPHNSLKNRDADEAHPASAILDASGKSQQEINDNNRCVDTIVGLLAIPAPKDGMRVSVKSYHSGKGRGGGTFVWNAASTLNDDGGIVLKVPSITTGRWVRVIETHVNPFMFGAYDGLIANIDSYSAIQKFFDYIAVNNVGTADASGYFLVSQGLELNGAKRPIPGVTQIATMNIIGSPTFRAQTAIDTVLKLYNCSGLSWEGIITTLGTGSTAISGRTCRLGVRISRSGRSKFGGFNIQNFKLFGLDITDEIGNTSALELGEVITRNCGSGSPTAGTSIIANYSNRVDVPNIPSPSLSRSILTVDTLPDASDVGGWYRSELFCRIDGVTYNIMEIDRDNSTVSVYPIIKENANLTGSITYVIGGGVNLRGSDANIVGFGMLDMMTCGIGIDMGSLYGPVVKRVISQNNGVGVVIGLRIAGAMVSFNFGTIYCEGNFVDIWRHTAAASDGGYVIGNEYALNPAKILGNPAKITSIFLRGKLHNYEKQGNNLDRNSSRFDLSFDKSDKVTTFFKDSWTIGINPPNADLNRLFGMDSYTLIFIGSGTAGTPTGSFTFNIPTGWTVNGSTTPVVFSDFSGGPVIFSMYCLMGTKEIKIACSSEITRKNTSNVSAQSVAANSKYIQNVTIAGVSLGDDVAAAYTKSLNGLMLNAYVNAEGTVTCEFINSTATSIALEAGSLKLKITKF